VLRRRSTRDDEFEEFYAARFDGARRFVYAMCGNWTEAEEITQATFVRVYGRWSKVRAETADAYLRTALTRSFLDTRRRVATREQAMAQPPDAVVYPDTTEEDRQPLHAALLAVPPGQRVVLVLRFVKDLSVEQVAEELGCSMGTVKSQTARGLTTLRKAYHELTSGRREATAGCA
jgi:RNA polymerase sigma-70 factor (sigma-E family)